MEGHAVGGEPCAQRRRQLAAGAHVQAQTLLLHPLRDSGAQERLAGIEDVGPGEIGEGLPEGVAEAGGAASEILRWARRPSWSTRRISEVATAGGAGWEILLVDHEGQRAHLLSHGVHARSAA